MSETVSTPETPKKSKKTKVLVMITAALVLLLGTNHFTIKLGYNTEAVVTVTDSTITVAPQEISPASTDTTIKDTIKN